MILGVPRMNRFVRFFKRIFVPVLSHDASRVAKKRIDIAAKITDDQIYVSTVRNALNVPDASLSDKLTFAFTSLPEATTNFPYAKGVFFDILDFLESNEEISSDVVNLLKSSLENIESLDQIMKMATA
jgi:hypothetical protein